MTTAITAENTAIINALTLAGGWIMDDHRREEFATMQTRTVIVFTRTERETGKVSQDVCPALEKAELFCLNPLYMKGEATHLSRWSIGGNVCVQEHGSLEAAVEALPRVLRFPDTDVEYEIVRF